MEKSKKCTVCNGIMGELVAKTPEGITYKYFRCEKCGEEIVDMSQLHEIAQKYREIKRFHVKISRWGMSLGLRIPKELVEKYHLRDNKEITIVPGEKDIKLIPM